MSVSISGAGSISGLDQGFNVTTGSVGVGTDAPQAPLHLFGSSDILLEIESTDRYSHIDLTDNSSTARITNDGGTGTLRLRADKDNAVSNSNIQFEIDGTEKLRIASDGDLDFKSTDGVGINFLESGYINIDSDNNDSSRNFTFYDAKGTGSESILMRILDNGNTGIGIDNPSARLDVVSNDASAYIAEFRQAHASNTAQIIIDSPSDGASRPSYMDYATGGTVKWRTGLAYLDTNRSFHIGTGSIPANSKLTIKPDGYVGIGTDNPNKILRVEYPDPGTGSNGLTQKDTGNDTTTFFGTVGPSYNYIGHSGHAGMVYSSRDLAIGVDHNNSGVIKFYTGGAERLRIKSNGHIHIGNPIELANVATTTHTFALSGNSDNTFSCPGSVSISGATAYNTANYAGSGLRFLGKYNSSGQYTTFAHVGGIKENTIDGNYAGALTFHTRNHGGLGAERMRITSLGHVTMPSQPCFWATSNTGGSDTSNGYTGIISNQFEAAYVNIGNHYNTSTGVFTCPVAGTYEFHGQGLIRHQTGVGRAELTFYKNGSNTISRSYGYTYITGASDHDNLHVMGYITCAANDQIDLRVYACDSGIDVYWGQGLGYFAGRLVQ